MQEPLGLPAGPATDHEQGVLVFEPEERVERRALLALKGHFQLDNLLVFNRKFFPNWERRFLVYERRRDLPRVGLAALAAEAYLPFSGRDRR